MLTQKNTNFKTNLSFRRGNCVDRKFSYRSMSFIDGYIKVILWNNFRIPSILEWTFSALLSTLWKLHIRVTDKVQLIVYRRMRFFDLRKIESIESWSRISACLSGYEFITFIQSVSNYWSKLDICYSNNSDVSELSELCYGFTH